MSLQAHVHPARTTGGAAAAATSTQMWRLPFVNIDVSCTVSSVNSIVADMTKTTQQVKFAVQRHNAEVDDWDTIRDTITPLEARARRLVRRKRSLSTRCKFRLVKVETQTTITPIEAGCDATE